MSTQRRYITTPIYYCNDVPHIGHIYTTTICDAYARFMRLAGREVFFLTGTDEHGVKVEKSANARGVTPQALADENSAAFQRVMSAFGITNNDFIRTTQPRHTAQVQALVAKLLANDAIYLGTFEGWYDEGQEEYYTETKAKELNYTSPISKKPLTRATERNYYFRLSAFQKPLEELFEKNPGFVRPESRRNEVIGRLREGLQDVPISRTNFSWGIQMPNDPQHVIYVWIDALFNYITALGLASPLLPPPNATAPAPSPQLRAEIAHLHNTRHHYWPADYHVIGKEILWFHAVIWPAVLMALELPIPRCIYAHSFWISEGQKMSKTMGNFIDLEAISRYTQTYGHDAWRYYLITQGPLGSSDADFAAARFHSIYEKDLVSTVGNCASRVTAMISRYCDGKVPAPSANTSGANTSGGDWPAAAQQAVDKATQAAEELDLPGVVDAAMELIRSVDGYINATEPFKLAKDPARKSELDSILYNCIEAIRIASLLLWPVLPWKMEELWNAIGLLPLPLGGEGRGEGTDHSAPNSDATTPTATLTALRQSPFPNNQPLAALARWGTLKPGTPITKVALFPRVEQAPAPAAAARP